VNIVTQGAAGLDFTATTPDSSSTLCTAQFYAGAATCTVDVTFAPLYPGERMGAVVIRDHDGHIIGEAFLHGTGVGPQVNFLAGANSAEPVILLPNVNINSETQGIAVDASGDIFLIVDEGSTIERWTRSSSGSYSGPIVVSTLANHCPGFSVSFAVDGAGSVYFTNCNAATVYRAHPVGSGYNTAVMLKNDLTEPASVAVDGSGTVYILDRKRQIVVKETPAGDTYTRENILLRRIDRLSSIAVDASGDIYVTGLSIVAPYQGEIVALKPASGTYTQSTVSYTYGAEIDTGIAVDGEGNLYFFGNTGPKGLWGLIEATPSGDGWVEAVLPSGDVYPLLLAVDGSRNLYMPGYSEISGILELPFAQPPGPVNTIDGPFTPVGTTSSAETVTLQNVGNAPLIFPSLDTGNNPIASSANFTLAAGGDGDCPVALSGSTSVFLAGGASCNLNIAFTPQLPTFGEETGSLALTDNTLNADNATQSILLSGNATDVVVGAFNKAVDATTGSSTVATGDNLVLSGWVADKYPGASITDVQVNNNVDDRYTPYPFLGDASFGLPSPEVAIAMNDPAYANAGWTLTVPGYELVTGLNHIRVEVLDSTFGRLVFPLAFVTGAAKSEPSPPFGTVDKAVSATTGSASVATNESVLVTGWAADPTLGAPVSRVAVLVDGSSAGSATLGVGRPDVAAGQHNSADTDSGWTFTEAASGLGIGTHTVTAVAYDSSGLSTTLGSRTFSVASTAAGPPLGTLVEAVDAITGQTTVSSGDNLVVQGWAADPTLGAPVASVAILIDGATVGSATLGFSRSQVAAKFSNSSYLHSGWTFALASSGLVAGPHTVRAVAYGTTGLSTVLGTTLITVTP
jgi:hypothetical protein